MNFEKRTGKSVIRHFAWILCLAMIVSLFAGGPDTYAAQTADAANPKLDHDTDLLLLVMDSAHELKVDAFDRIAVTDADQTAVIYAAPDQAGAVVGILPGSAWGEILSDADPDWYEIRSGEVCGYVQRKDVQTGIEGEKIAWQIGEIYVRITVEELNVRNAPNFYSVVAYPGKMDELYRIVPDGCTLDFETGVVLNADGSPADLETILTPVDDGFGHEWYRIQLDKQYCGYVYSSCVETTIEMNLAIAEQTAVIPEEASEETTLGKGMVVCSAASAQNVNPDAAPASEPAAAAAAAQTAPAADSAATAAQAAQTAAAQTAASSNASAASAAQTAAAQTAAAQTTAPAPAAEPAVTASAPAAEPETTAPAADPAPAAEPAAVASAPAPEPETTAPAADPAPAAEPETQAPAAETAAAAPAPEETVPETGTQAVVVDGPSVGGPSSSQASTAASASAPASSDPGDWGGEVLTAAAGTVQGPSGKETYYNLPMGGVVDIMRDMGNTDAYWVRDDGVKMLGDYVMCAANLDLYPRGSLVESSLGTCIVVDTGSFIYSNPTQLDIAVTW